MRKFAIKFKVTKKRKEEKKKNESISSKTQFFAAIDILKSFLSTLHKRHFLRPKNSENWNHRGNKIEQGEKIESVEKTLPAPGS